MSLWTAGVLYPAGTYLVDEIYVEEFEVSAVDLAEACILAGRQAKDELVDGWTVIEVRPYQPELIVMHW